MFWKPWPAVELKKVLSVTKHGFVFWAQRKPNARLEIYKAFQDRLTFLNRHMIVWFSWICSICEIYWKDRTAGHLVFWKPWPVTGHIGHIGTAKQICVIWYSSRQKQITLSVYWFPRPNSFKTRKPISVSRNTANILECRQIEAVIKTFFAFHEL